jgi:hypothetical protein
MLIDSESDPEWALSEDVHHAHDGVPEEDEESTPRPKQKNQDQFHQILNISTDNDSEPFETPLVLRRKKGVVIESEPDEDKEMGKQKQKGKQKETGKRKRMGKQKETGKRKRDQMGDMVGMKKGTMGDGKNQVGVIQIENPSQCQCFVLLCSI